MVPTSAASSSTATILPPFPAAPVLSAPDPAAPVLSAPVLSAPDLSAPDLSAPVLSAPVLSAPDPAAPDPAAPVLSAPDPAAPDPAAPVLSAAPAPTNIAFERFITGQRGNRQILDTDGYTYNNHKDKNSSTSSCWRCTKHRSLKCPSRVFLAFDEAPDSLCRGQKLHNHPPDPKLGERHDVISSLKRKASDQPLSATQNLVTEAQKSSSSELNTLLPTEESLRRIVQRSRARACGSAMHPEAKDAEEFVLPPTCSVTHRGDPFVLFDDFTDAGSRLIVFSTQRNLQTLSDHPNWICDGTFYVCPPQFQQSYTFHAVIDGKCLPLIYALLSDKKEKTYTFLLTVIKDALGNLLASVGIVMIDFEKAAMNAFRNVFESFTLINCFFHLCQSVQKNIFKKFKILYYKDKDFARASRLVVFLAFVPMGKVDDAFEELSIYIASKYPNLLSVVNYFELTYLGLSSADCVERSEPRFPAVFWNHYNTIMVDFDYPRTSNMVEGFHRGFKTRVNRAKPSVQEYFRGISEQQVATDFHLDRLAVGISPAKKRKTRNRELYDICCAFEDYESILEYLFEVAKYFGHEI